jgi:hypothetical protein
MRPIWPHTPGMNTLLTELAVAQGVTANSLKKWKKRGKVPFRYRLPLVEAAQKKGVALTSRDFEFGTAKPKKRRAS